MPNDIFLNSTPAGLASTLLKSRPVVDGEPVNAAVTNRVPVTNQGNIAYIHDLLKTAYDHSGEFLWGIPIADDVVAGDFVYYDSVRRVFDKALAKFVIQDGRQTESETSVVWGIVTRVDHNEADLCTDGLCKFRSELPCYTAEPEPGVRYLSDRIPGEPTGTRIAPAKCLGYLVGVKATGEVQFFVRQSLSLPLSHQHQVVELVATPAGTWTATNPQAGITSIRPDQPGWIPATHPIFAGKVPNGAVYGYNPVFLTNHCQWPLRFADNAGLRWQRHNTETDDPLAASVPQELYRIDETTIWWMSGVTQYLPWDTSRDYVEGKPTTDSPVTGYAHRMWLDFVNSGYGLSDMLVSSLRAEEGSGLTITQHPFGGPAVHGDLKLGFHFRFRKANEKDTSGLAVKGIDKFDMTLGPVVSGIKLDSSLMRIIKSDHSEDNYHFGQLVIGDPSGQIGQELPFEAIHLNGVEEAVEREAIGLAFSATRESSLIARIIVPHSNNFSAFKMSLFFGVLVTRSGNIAANALRLSYRIITNPQNKNRITQAFPSLVLNPLPCDFSVQNSQYSTGYYTAESGMFPVSPGDVVLVKIERKPPDNFNDRIILLRKAAILHLA